MTDRYDVTPYVYYECTEWTGTRGHRRQQCQLVRTTDASVPVPIPSEPAARRRRGRGGKATIVTIPARGFGALRGTEIGDELGPMRPAFIDKASCSTNEECKDPNKQCVDIEVARVGKDGKIWNARKCDLNNVQCTQAGEDGTGAAACTGFCTAPGIDRVRIKGNLSDATPCTNHEQCRPAVPTPCIMCGIPGLEGQTQPCNPYTKTTEGGLRHQQNSCVDGRCMSPSMDPSQDPSLQHLRNLRNRRMR